MKKASIINLFICTFLITFTFFTQSVPAKQVGQAGSILFISDMVPFGDMQPSIEPETEIKLAELGWATDTIRYSEISLEKLRNFNVVCVGMLPRQTNMAVPAQREAWLKQMEILKQYVRDGGGLYYQSDISISGNVGTESKTAADMDSLFFNDLGLVPLGEDVTDAKTQFRQKLYLTAYFAKTTDIIPHPITKGITSFTYPTVPNMGVGATTRTMKVDSDWTVLIRGGASTTYKDGSPICAVREYGKGRILYMPIGTVMNLHAGHHVIWEDIMMGKGNYMTLFTNAVAWLAEPSKSQGAPGGFTKDVSMELPKGIEYHKEFPQPPQPASSYTPKEKKSYKGIIGIHSTASDGLSTIKEYCTEAKRLGLDYLVFTEALPLMNEKKWGTLVKVCDAESTSTFTAIPGIEYEANGIRRIVVRPLKWFDKSWLNADGTKVTNDPAVLFDNHWPLVGLVNPKTSATIPDVQKFFTGYAIIDYNNDGEPIEPGMFLADDPTYSQNQIYTEHFIKTAFADYLHLANNGYHPMPFVYNAIRDARQLKNAAGGYTTRLYDNDLPTGRAKREAYVSNGPEILDYTIEDGWWSYREWRWYLHITAASDADIAEIAVFDGPELYRRILIPEGNKKFTTTFSGYHDKQRAFVVVVRDVKGQKAISWCETIGSRQHSLYMCADMQNTIDSGNVMRTDGKEENVPMMGWIHTGNLGGHIPGYSVPSPRFFPSGLDSALKGFYAYPRAALMAKEGYENHANSSNLSFYFASGDMTSVEYNSVGAYYPRMAGFSKGEPKFIDNTAHVYSWTPTPGNFTLLSFDSVITFKRDVTLQTLWGTHHPFIVAYLGGNANSFPNYVYINKEGKKVEGKRPMDEQHTFLTDTVKRGGYVGLYPDFYGSGALFPLDKDYDFGLRWGSVNMTYGDPGDVIRKGTKLTTSFLAVRGRFGEDGSRWMDTFRRAYGMTGKPAYTASAERGKIISTVFTLDVDAEDYGAILNLSRAALPNRLPIRINGLNDSWDALVYDLDTKTTRRFGVRDDMGYVNLNLDKQSRLFFGNPVICDNMDVTISVFLNDKDITIELNNPTVLDTDIMVRSQDELKDLFQFEKKLHLKSGERVEFTVPRK